MPQAQQVLTPARSMPAESWRHGAAVFILVLCNFLLSAPRNVMLDDDGYFILAAWFGGVAHPPGYPLYTLIANLFAHLPLGSVAFRVHACSAFFGALACAVLWCLTRRLTGSRMAGWIAALCYGSSGAFWSEATVAEVYSLNAFLFFLLLWLCMDPAVNRTRRQAIMSAHWIAGIFGLSLANHWPLMALSFPALMVAAWPRRVEFYARPLSVFFSFCIGLLPYAWMVHRSRVSEIAFFGPIGNWSDFWFYISRQAYTGIDYSVSAGWEDKLRYVGLALTESARQFGWLGAALGLTGLVAQWRVLPRPWCWALLLGFAGSSVVLAALLGFAWDLLHRYTFEQYPLVAYGILAIWLALGANTLITRVLRAVPALGHSRILPWALGLLLVGNVWLHHAPANFRAHDHWAADFAGTLLQSLAPGAALFTFGDYATGPLAYLNRVEGVRPDVEIFNVNGQLFRNRLVSPRADDPEAIAAAIDAFVERQERPVYYNMVLPHRYGVIAHGLFFEVGRNLAPGMHQAYLTPEIAVYFAQLFARGEPRDTSQLIHYRQLSAPYCRTLAGLSLARPGETLARLMEQRCGGFYGLLERAAVLMDANSGEDARAIALLLRAELHQDEAVSVEAIASMDNQLGFANERVGEHGRALEFFRRSWSRWPDPANPARPYIHPEGMQL
jgi:hypothetical protein